MLTVCNFPFTNTVKVPAACSQGSEFHNCPDVFSKTEKQPFFSSTETFIKLFSRTSKVAFSFTLSLFLAEVKLENSRMHTATVATFIQ